MTLKQWLKTVVMGPMAIIFAGGGETTGQSARDDPMTFEEVDKLLDEVMGFLLECGETYKSAMSGFIEKHLLLSLIHGTYIYKPGYYFMSYKLISESSVKDLGEKVYSDLLPGNVFACLDAGVKSGFNEMLDRAVTIAKENRCKTVAYYRHNEGIKHYEVPNYVG